MALKVPGGVYGRKDSRMTYFFGGRQRAFRNCGNFVLVIEMAQEVTCLSARYLSRNRPKLASLIIAGVYPFFVHRFFSCLHRGSMTTPDTLAVAKSNATDSVKKTPDSLGAKLVMDRNEVFLKRNKAETFPVLFLSPWFFKGFAPPFHWKKLVSLMCFTDVVSRKSECSENGETRSE